MTKYEKLCLQSTAKVKDQQYKNWHDCYTTLHYSRSYNIWSVRLWHDLSRFLEYQVVDSHDTLADAIMAHPSATLSYSIR